jgi:hypothetical protein
LGAKAGAEYIHFNTKEGLGFRDGVLEDLAAGEVLDPAKREPADTIAALKRPPRGPFLSVSQNVALDIFAADYLPDIFADVPLDLMGQFYTDLNKEAMKVAARFRRKGR